MENNKKNNDISHEDENDDRSDDSTTEYIRNFLSKPIPSNYFFDYFKPVEMNFDEMLPKGLVLSEMDRLQELSETIGLNPLDSFLEAYKLDQSLTDDYLHLFSIKNKSLENLKTSASAVNNLLKSEPGTVSKEDFEKKLKKLGKAKVDDDEINRDIALRSRTSLKGFQYLKNNPDLYKNFEGSLINTTVVSIDIRSSTQLMLNAKSPSDFVAFISDLSTSLSTLVKSFFGIYDKFTGDGLLCFFPIFYSGEDHVYLALLLADSCHRLFQKIYAKHHDKFSVVRSDVGLGIGIDVGDTYLTFVNYEPTVIGTSVVYACRLSGAPFNTTYINQQVYEVIKNKYQDNFEITPREIEFKGQGKMRVYKCVFSKELDPMPLPDWAKPGQLEMNESKEKI